MTTLSRSLLFILCASIIAVGSDARGESRSIKVVPSIEQREGGAVTAESAAPRAHGTRRALVIGNSRYAVSPLRNPAHDAEDLARVLARLGFSVTKVIDADKEGMLAAIDRFGRELKRGDIGLFYFAGHGLQVFGKNYLLPVDVGPLRSQGEVPYKGINAQLVMDRLEAAGNMMNLVVLDACRDNPFAPDDTRPRGLAQMDAPKGTLIVYATKPGSVAEDGLGRNGIFTRNLLQRIGSAEDVQLMLRKVRCGVIEETQGRQVPWDEGTLVYGFSFAQEGGGGVAGTVESASAAVSEGRRPSVGSSSLSEGQSFRQVVGEVEALGTSRDGELKVVFTSCGISALQDPVSWRVAAEREAMKKVKKAVADLFASPPYSLSERRIAELFGSGNMLGAEYLDEAKKITVRYQILLDDRYH